MKFASVAALIAVAAAADPKPVKNAWDKCSAGSDCSLGWICCSLKKKADGSDVTTSIKICTDLKQNGTVPSSSTAGYAGYTYFCAKADHTDPTNAGGSTLGGNTASARSLAVTTTSAAVVASFLFA